MNERSMQIWVGLMMFVTLIALCVLAWMFGTLPTWIGGGEYTIYVTFEQAPGVSVGTPVRKSGILIGRVTDVRFAPDGSSIVVTAEIKNKWRIFRNEVCRVQTSLLGDAVLEFLRSTSGEPPGEPIRNGAHLSGIFIPDPNQLVANIQSDFKNTIASVSQTSSGLRTASEDLSVTLKKLSLILDDNREGIRKAIEQTNTLLGDTREIVGDEATRRQLRESIRQLPEMIQDTHETIRLLNETVARVDKNLKNIEGFTEPLGEHGQVLIANLDRGTARLDQLVNEMLRFSRSLNSSEGTVGQLIHNPELYQRMTRAARNLDEISRQLRPILNDARVFSDKIARHPELLGVRGAVKGSVGVK
ncbi:MAG: MCE family protein [Pirellulales bacterium]|nr:MCE family protein [Pirellulales bacterium]